MQLSDITQEQQAKNAIQWIDALPSYKQAPKGQRNRLGNAKDGFCCLGAGCQELGVNFKEGDSVSVTFAKKVGLKEENGCFVRNKSDILEKPMRFFGYISLTEVNDETNAGFKRIANLMKTNPHWTFTPPVAALIAEHYKEQTQ